MLENLRVIHYENKIRLGNNADGGYVIADIPNYDCYISAGIGGDESFSRDLISHFNIKEAHGFDGTIDNLPQNSPDKMHFYKMNSGIVSIFVYGEAPEYKIRLAMLATMCNAQCA